MKKIDITKLVGKRILCKKMSHFSARGFFYYELEVLELAPSKKFVKIKHISDRESWQNIEYFKEDVGEVVEVLGGLKKKPVLKMECDTKIKLRKVKPKRLSHFNERNTADY